MVRGRVVVIERRRCMLLGIVNLGLTSWQYLRVTSGVMFRVLSRLGLNSICLVSLVRLGSFIGMVV